MLLSRRFCGPPDSANGGYVCGLAAALLDGPAEVTLRSPPPLERELAVEREADAARVKAGDQVVAEARATGVLALEVPAAPSWDEATAARARFLWWDSHPYPTCFVCGPRRSAGDGLCIHPGAVHGRTIAAAPFVPDASLADADGRVRPEMLWAALDCPSWFGFNCFHEFDGMILLGRLAARIDQRPRVGQRCISVGWFLGREGRKIHCGSALYAAGDGGSGGEGGGGGGDGDGALLAVGKATWIALK